MEEFNKNHDPNADSLEVVYNRLLSIYNTTDSQKVLVEIGTVFRAIPDYRDSKKLAIACFVKAREFEKRDTYDRAMKYYEKGDISSLNMAISEFNKIPDYSDSNNMIRECRSQIQLLKAERRLVLYDKKRKNKNDSEDNDTFKMIFSGIAILSVIFVIILIWNAIF